MNTYLEAQINQMRIYIDTFVKGCELAAIKDDGKIGKEEEKQLKKIQKASEEYKRELSKINK